MMQGSFGFELQNRLGQAWRPTRLEHTRYLGRSFALMARLRNSIESDV